MENDAVLIAGKLDSTELKVSVKDLVDLINTSTKSMAESFDTAISKMTSDLKVLVNEQRTATEETKRASKERAASYDQEAQAMQRATRGRRGAGGYDTIQSDVDPTMSYVVQLNKDVDAQLNQIIQKEAQLVEEKQKEAQITQQIAQAQKQTNKNIGNFEITGNIQEQERMSRAIQNQARALDELKRKQQEMPTSKKLLGLDENSIDNISRKIKELTTYRNTLNITNPKDRQEIEQINGALDRLKRKQQEIMGQNKEFMASNNALTRSFNYMKNRLAFYLTIGASTQFVRQLVDIRSQYELLERSIGILVDSMQQGKQIFSELNAMALKSPFTTMELGAAAKQLVAYDIAAKDVVDTTRRLADMAAAVGIPVERLTYALGQVKAYGYLNARDARMFANAGIPLVKELADKYTELEGRLVSTADVYDRIKKKAISFEDVMETVNKMTDEGGKFFNFQEKAADTLRVKIANLTLAYNNFLNELGQEEQGLISGTLGGIKTLLENWRAIDKAIKAIAISWGITKGAMLGGLGMILAAQKLGVYHGRQITREMGMQAILGKRLGGMLGNIGASIAKFATNPLTWVTAAIASIAYLVLQYHELQKANDAFNKSLQDNSDENIKSIDKFFEDYKENLDSIGGEGIVEQQKMWEKIQDEIEKVTKNSDGYVEILEQISDYTERIGKSEAILEQSKIIDEEVKRLAGHGVFDLGGGFADEDLAKDLKDYEKYVNRLSKHYSDLNNARETFFQYNRSTKEIEEELAQANDELDKFVSKLDQANIEKIMGDSGDREIMLANLREYASIIRDNFLQTEKGQKISIEGQAKLNKWIDEWIASKGKANNLIGEERRQIESNRTAWELFFNNIRGKDRETLDYIIRTNKYGSEEFKKIWDKAAKNMAESSMTSYDQIQQQIKDLRDTPDIVIKVIYKDEIKKGDAQQQQFVKDLMTPDESNIHTPKEYMKGVRELTKKYGRFQKKDGEDNVEWEKRLGETYRKNAESIGKLNKQLKDKEELQAADREKKEEELDQLKQEQEALEVIRKREHFDYSKTTKGGSKKDAILELLKQEIDLVKKLQSEYDKLTKKGETRENASEFVESQYEKTIKLLNAKLTGVGLPTIDASIIRGNKNDTLDFFKQLSEILESKGLSNVERMKAVEGVIREFSMAVKEENLDKIIKGLNSDLSKVKDEYELALELDANPEMAGFIKDWMGVSDEDLKNLPRTYSQAISKLQDLLNTSFANDNIGLDFNIEDLLKEEDFKKWVEENGHLLDDNFVKALDAIRKYAEKLRNDEGKQTVKAWSEMIEKYGEYEEQILKISRETAKKQVDVIKKYGSTEDVNKAVNLLSDLSFTSDPTEIARLQKELTEILQKVISGKEIAINVSEAISNEDAEKKSKVEWETFKKTELYAKTFENLKYVGTSSIKAIIKQLDALKDKVKADPASMKALMDSLEKAKEEMINRDPFGAMAKSAGELFKSLHEQAVATRELRRAERELRKERKSPDANPEKIAKGEEKVAKAREKQKKAQDKSRASLAKFQQASQQASSQMSDMANILTQVNDLLGLTEDSTAGQAINSMAKGFSTMATVLGIVAAASAVAEASMGWVAIIAAALAVLVGLVTFVANYKDNKILKKIKESEDAVKDLELAYKDLEYAMNKAYGTAEIKAKQLAIANKELQLVELERQLALQESRKGKKRDEDAIRDLKGQIKDLKHEIKDSADDIINSLLGISGVGDAVENMVSVVTNALRNGEDAMQSWNDSIDEMIVNMIKKFAMTYYLGPRFQKVFDDIQKDVDERSKPAAERLTSAEQQLDNAQKQYDKYSRLVKESGFNEVKYGGDLEKWRKRLEEAQREYDIAQEAYASASGFTRDDLRNLVGELNEFRGEGQGLYDFLNDLLGEFGLLPGQNGKLNLSALQQGIQGITEDQASALEAYWNANTQQQYLQSDLLTQIRDSVVAIDGDAQLGTLGEMLLQLQQSYQVQQTIQSIMEGWTTPNGMAVRVEMS